MSSAAQRHYSAQRRRDVTHTTWQGDTPEANALQMCSWTKSADCFGCSPGQSSFGQRDEVVYSGEMQIGKLQRCNSMQFHVFKRKETAKSQRVRDLHELLLSFNVFQYVVWVRRYKLILVCGSAWHFTFEVWLF